MIKKKKISVSPLMIVLGVVLLIYVISLILPFCWALMSSVKDRLDFTLNPFGLPEEWFFSNYGDVFSKFAVPINNDTERIGFFQLIGNSLIYALGCAFLSALTPCIMAYAVAKFDYKFSKILYGVVIFTMILPIVGSTPSSINVLRAIGLYDTFWGVFLLKTHFLGTYFLVFHATFKNTPKDYSEAAYIDGGGNFTVLFRIVIPMIRNIFFTVMLLQFVTFWNDFNTPLIYMPNNPTLALGIYVMDNLNDNSFTIPMRLASCMIGLLPVLVLFLIFHERLLGKISMGGLKE